MSGRFDVDNLGVELFLCIAVRVEPCAAIEGSEIVCVKALCAGVRIEGVVSATEGFEDVVKDIATVPYVQRRRLTVKYFRYG